MRKIIAIRGDFYSQQCRWAVLLKHHWPAGEFQEAFDKMCDRASQKGANAVIGVRCETQGYV
jgi:hypothetical protein